MALALPSNWATYLGSGRATEATDFWHPEDAGAQQALAWVRQFDPNAQIRQQATGTGALGSWLDYNNALLPQNVLGGRGIENIARGTPGSGERLANPNAVVQDPIYGPVTNWRNLRERGPTMVDILGPLLVGGAIGFGGGFSALGSLFSKLPNVANTLSGMMQRPSTGITPSQLALMRILSQNRG